MKVPFSFRKDLFGGSGPRNLSSRTNSVEIPPPREIRLQHPWGRSWAPVLHNLNNITFDMCFFLLIRAAPHHLRRQPMGLRPQHRRMRGPRSRGRAEGRTAPVAGVALGHLQAFRAGLGMRVLQVQKFGGQNWSGLKTVQWYFRTLRLQELQVCLCAGSCFAHPNLHVCRLSKELT